MLRKNFRVVLLLTVGVYAQGKLPLVDVYNANIGYVHEWRNFELQKGLNMLQISGLPHSIDPISIQLQFERPAGDLKLLEQKFQTPLPLQSLYQQSLGKQIKINLEETGPQIGTLLQVDGQHALLQTDAPSMPLLLVPLEQITWAMFAAGLQPALTAPLLTWQVESKVKATVPAELSYQVDGISWNAAYVLCLAADECSFSWSGLVNLNNASDLHYEQANLRLIAGNLNLARSKPLPTRDRAALTAMAKSAETADFEEQALADYHVYPLNRPLAIGRQEQQQIQLFDKVQAKGTKVYLFSNYIMREFDGNLLVTFRFTNSKENNLGLPLPAGNVRIFTQAQPAPLFSGHDVLNHTAVNDTIALTIGEAFDVKGRHIVKERTAPKPRSELLTIEIELNNQKNSPVKVRVEERIDGDWYVKSASHKYVRPSNRLLLFPLQVEAQQKQTITYTVQRNW